MSNNFFFFNASDQLSLKIRRKRSINNVLWNRNAVVAIVIKSKLVLVLT